MKHRALAVAVAAFLFSTIPAFADYQFVCSYTYVEYRDCGPVSPHWEWDEYTQQLIEITTGEECIVRGAWVSSCGYVYLPDPTPPPPPPPPPDPPTIGAASIWVVSVDA